ncbi:hypothetical protein Zmor_011985 [Zophobas morio]|uniref:Uncharacterized protein n=1 Tax=Zophobas morio TaxID=2755281 RepID=A0AA38LZ92_9CUCU|nr:hypothetical protein Zmor_011985 [Zophobas morio]
MRRWSSYSGVAKSTAPPDCAPKSKGRGGRDDPTQFESRQTNVISAYKTPNMALLTSDLGSCHNATCPSFFVVTLTANALLVTVELKIRTEKLRNTQANTTYACWNLNVLRTWRNGQFPST